MATLTVHPALTAAALTLLTGSRHSSWPATSATAPYVAGATRLFPIAAPQPTATANLPACLPYQPTRWHQPCVTLWLAWSHFYLLVTPAALTAWSSRTSSSLERPCPSASISCADRICKGEVA
ncbi:hypothetical protein HaLaN_01706, partial [Haematococcus lacustris]